jgi:hypothetical protein
MTMTMNTLRSTALFFAASLVSLGCGSPAATSASVDAGSDAVSAASGSEGGVADGKAFLSTEAGEAEAGPSCTAAWCIVTPSPVPNSVSASAIYGFAANDIWAVADGGLILHYDGTSWTSSVHGMYDLSNVWGAAPNDVWIVGDGGTILHWDGSTWSPVLSNTNLSLGWVWGSSSSNVWIVGDQGTVLQWTGTAWTKVDAHLPELEVDGGLGAVGDGGAPVDLGAVWTDAPNDVWIVADDGVIARFDGTNWTVVPSGTPLSLGGIWGTGPNDIWAGGDCMGTAPCTGSTLLHWDGTAWTQTPNFPGTYDLASIWGFGPNDVWVASDYGDLFHYDGTKWSKSPTPTMLSLSDMWGADPSHVWVVGDLGLFLEKAP